MDFNVKELLSCCENDIAAYVVKLQMLSSEADEGAVRAKMLKQLHVMKASVTTGLDPSLRSVSGLTGGQAAKLHAHKDKALCGQTVGTAIAYALAVAENNACMGQIVAAPTAGACGILPGCLIAYQQAHDVTDDQIVDALFVAAAFGHVIASMATISGAEGGCQAECGSASAMAAAALTTLQGGSPHMAADACAFALMNTMGLICDPVGGLVEVPCVYRNVGGVGNAFTAADMALSGIRSPIPCDEVILAMKDVGDAMPATMRETGEGGCAKCPSVCKKG